MKCLLMDLFSWLILPIFERQFDERHKALFAVRVYREEKLTDELATNSPYVRSPKEYVDRRFAEHDYETAIAKELMLIKWRESLKGWDRSPAAWQYVSDLDKACLNATLHTFTTRIEADQAAERLAIANRDGLERL